MNEILGAGLLLAMTIGLFIAVIIPPISKLTNWMEKKPVSPKQNLQDFLDWINNGLDKIFGSETNENSNQTSTENSSNSANP